MVYIVSLLCGFLISAITLFVAKIFDMNPKPIFGVYQTRNGVYWLKVWIMYGILLIRKIRQRLSPKSEEYYNNLEHVQELSPTPNAVDGIYFNGTNKNGDYLAVGTARRPNRLVDGFIYVKIKNSKFGLLELLKTPDSSLFNTEEEESYAAEGIKMNNIEPMKKWKVTYSGQLREHYNPQNTHNVTMETLFSSDKPWFDYETGVDPWSMAKTIAYEKWSKSLFNNIKERTHLHYEQFGLGKTKIVIDDQEFNIDFDVLRDHSVCSNRQWGTYKKYAIHWGSTENGDHFSVGSICQPIVFSRLEIGYMYKAQENKIYPVVNNDFQLYQHGENGEFPKDYALSFQAGNTNYVMQVNIIESPHFYISKDWESKMYECLCTFEVNGVKGHGGAEWEYRNVDGRNVKLT